MLKRRPHGRGNAVSDHLRRTLTIADTSITLPEREDYYVYVLFRETGIPFYVGKGRGRRIDRHKFRSKTDNSQKERVVEHMRTIGFDVPYVKVAENLTEKKAFETEIIFIAAIGRMPDGPLVNHTAGGPGLADPSFEIKKSRRKAALNRPRNPESMAKFIGNRKGAKLTVEQRAKISAVQKGRKQSPAHIAARSAANKGRRNSPESIERGAAKRRGRKLSPEHLAKASIAALGRTQSDKERAMRSVSWKASEAAQKHLKRVCEANRGKKRTPEQIANLKAAWVKRKARTTKRGSIDQGFLDL